MIHVLKNLRPGLALAAIALFGTAPAFAQHGWPVEPTNSDHPMGNSFGEFQDFGGVYQHTGIDILGTPMLRADGTEDTSAPWIRATVGGTVASLGDSGTGSTNLYNGTIITDTGGIDYRYWHLQGGSYHADYVNHHNNNTAVAAGDRIAKLVFWTSSGFHHLHYDLVDGNRFLSPLADITPNPDPDLPDIQVIAFARDNSDPWIPFNSVGAGACTQVNGQVDIIVQMRDRDDAGSTHIGAATLWVHNVRWRACPDADPNCPWQNTHAFDEMPTTCGTGGNALSTAYYSNRTPWDSSSNYGAATWLYGVATNFSGGTPNVIGSWDTSAMSNGSYTVSVEATDFAGNTKLATARVCVQNGPGCVTELAIRDAADDPGTIPYAGSAWWYSPDLTVNPGTPDEDRNVNIGTANPIEVRVWNYGNCAVPAGTQYDVCLGWGLPSSTVAHPLPASQRVGCQIETVPAGGWPVGTSRTAHFNWTPTATQVPLGHHCLVAWVDVIDDPVQNTPAVNWDDNRAQENITFQPAAPSAPSSSSFWINPQKMIKQRDVELTFSYSGQQPTVEDIRLLVSPGLHVERVVGGDIVGGFQGDRPVLPCKLSPDELHRVMCMSWREAAESGYTRVIGGIDPNGRVSLQGIQMRREPIRVMLQVRTKDDVGKGEFASVDVLEYGRLDGQENIVNVGGLTMRFEH